MSSSSHSPTRRALRTWLPGFCLLALGLEAAPAQEIAFVPQGEVSAEWASNRTLTVPSAPNSEDYSATLGGDLLRRTQVSDIDLRPLVTVQHSSEISNLDRLEALVDLVSDYRTLRSEFTLNAEYHREDAYNAQYGLVAFNPLNPNAPDTQGTGAIITGITKTSYLVAPEFNYDITPRVGFVASASLDAARYTTDIPNELVSYNSPEAYLGLTWALSPNSRVGAGPYYAYYDPIHSADGTVKNNAYGVSFDYQTKFSAVSQSKLTVKVERDSQPAAFGLPSSQQTVWGFEWVGSHKFLTSSVQYSVGRFLQPTSAGGRTSVEEVRVQYLKAFTARWSFNGAVRLTRDTEIATFADDESGDRDRANVQLALSYLFTPTWSVSGGYRYAYLKFTDPTISAHSNAIFLTVDYHGLQPPRN
jgi:hypothetical protein